VWRGRVGPPPPSRTSRDGVSKPPVPKSLESRPSAKVVSCRPYSPGDCRRSLPYVSAALERGGARRGRLPTSTTHRRRSAEHSGASADGRPRRRWRRATSRGADGGEPLPEAPMAAAERSATSEGGSSPLVWCVAALVDALSGRGSARLAALCTVLARDPVARLHECVCAAPSMVSASSTSGASGLVVAHFGHGHRTNASRNAGHVHGLFTRACAKTPPDVM
jgi:hypothetical protein